MIKAVVFDLWETIITERPESPEAWKRLRLERMARILNMAPHQVEGAYRHVWTRCHELYWSADKDIPCRTQIEHFLEPLQIEVDDRTMEALEDAYATVAVEVLPKLVDGAAEVLEKLRSRFALGLISNTGRTPGSALRVILERLDVARFFDAMVFSNEHGECKPQRSIFEAIRSRLGVEFHEMVFVGDNPYVDVYGAQRCGMRAVLFVPSKRGTAVAPDVDHGLTITPDATIRDLRELVGSELQFSVFSTQSRN